MSIPRFTDDLTKVIMTAYERKFVNPWVAKLTGNCLKHKFSRSFCRQKDKGETSEFDLQGDGYYEFSQVWIDKINRPDKGYFQIEDGQAVEVSYDRVFGYFSAQEKLKDAG